jgi:two-component system, OmpR family, phosphate regulon sensor histidine kinase PhoR
MEFAWLLVGVLLVLSVYLLMRRRVALMENTLLRRQLRELQDQNRQSSAQLAGETTARDVLAETIVDPVFFVDTDRRITYCNGAARRLSRGASESGPGRSLMESLRSYELDNIVEEVLGDRHELPREVTLNERLFRVRVTVLEKDGAKTGAVLVLRDVSELQRLGRARRDFVANISHELRTPLTAIRLLTDTLRMNTGADATQRASQLDQISTQVDILTQLAQEMYDLSQIESGQVPMRMVPVSLCDLVNRSISRLAPQAERAGTTLSNEVATDVYALADPDQIGRVLTNLLHNAIKFAPRGNVTVLITQDRPPQLPPSDASAKNGLPPEDADMLTVAVRDTGVGIAREDLPRIFERFYKVSRARGQGGTGLGLAIAKHIVEAHGGHIWVQSEEGKGATFFFTVPGEE